MSHVNAALMPRHASRIARRASRVAHLVVDGRWPVVHAAHQFNVSWPAAKRWAEQHGSIPLHQRTSDQTVARDQAAAVAIGRCAHGHRIKRQADGTRTQQRMSPDTTAKPIRNSKARAAQKD